MAKATTCGMALPRLLECYGVDTVFGIPGAHTLELYRGLAASRIRHVLARNEQGAGFMADGYARASGQAGVCLVISGPGVTNAATALGQAYADSVPVLLISAVTARNSLGKGWGCLHEITDQRAVTAPLTAFSATALSPEEIPELVGQAFAVFQSGRPRPVHIEIPVDVLGLPAANAWTARVPPVRPRPDPDSVAAAAALLRNSRRPAILVGGGAAGARGTLQQIAERLDAAVIASCAGKGIVPDSHPLSLGGSIVRPEVQALLAKADVVLAIGTEISETDSFVEKLTLRGKLIRIDIDPRKINDLYPATVGIVGDAGSSAEALLAALGEAGRVRKGSGRAAALAAIRSAVAADLTPSERKHVRLLEGLRRAVPANTVIAGDIAQLVYTGAFAFPVEAPRLWHYPAGFCTLGCGLPNGIGARLALADRPVVVLAGDGGLMFTVQELVTAAELRLNLPIVVWNNGGLKQIRDDMARLRIPALGVDGINPDFLMLARACGCHGVRPDSLAGFEAAIAAALDADRPTVIEVNEGAAWLA